MEWKNVWEGGYKTEATDLPKLPFIKSTNMDFLRGVEGKIDRSEEHTSELQSRLHLVCRLLLEKKKKHEKQQTKKKNKKASKQNRGI